MKALVLTLAVPLLMLPATPVLASEVEGVRFVERIERDGVSLELHRAALMRYSFIDVYVAGLYLAPGAAVQDLLSRDAPRRLEIEYLRGFEADDFRRSTVDGIRKNVDAAAFTQLEPSITAMNRLYREIAPGDRYAVTYLPGVGTERAHNGEVLGTVPGPEFATAYLSIWFGPAPFDEALKRELLKPTP